MRDRSLVLLLSGLLLAVYMAAFVSSPVTIDGQATLAVASSLVKYGSPDIAVLGSAEGLLPPESRMGSFGVDGQRYAKKGIVPSLLLLPLVALSQILPALSLRAAAMLFNPLILTATALLLYHFARRLNSPPWTSFFVAIIFGAATFAVAYVQTLFGEPLAGLLLLVAVMSAYDYTRNRRQKALIVCGMALGLLCGINFSYLLLAPGIGLFAFGLQPQRWSVPHLTRLALPFLLILAVLLGFNLARFGSPLTSGYNFAEGEGFNSPFGLGVFGLLLSPYRGILWYSPVLLLAIPGAWWLQRINRA